MVLAHGCGDLSHPVLGKIFVLFLHGPKHARVLGRVCMAGIVYLKSAELGMTYLDFTEWENAKYRKRDFFIRFGSDNVRICGI
ncbi:hypothetical protein GOBAR_AA05004 [Gossypium barbadense]|uniref:Uncharacterized protein n=1 Tax=Gossypium barbadense TaxID=3634 RepID=A0A2P5YJ42_GOSBA|nr:hypothetical protein GOBAR_AA05004 [Gossypium barbadense]